MAPLPPELAAYSAQILKLIDSVFSDAEIPLPEDDRKTKRNKLNSNFHRAEFQGLWNRIHQKAVYEVEFKSEELIAKCIAAPLRGGPDDARHVGWEDMQVGWPFLAIAAPRREYDRYRWFGPAKLVRRGRVQQDASRLLHVTPTHGKIRDNRNGKLGKISHGSNSRP